MASFMSTALQTLIAHESDVTSCDFGRNFTLASVSSDKSVRLWEWEPMNGYVEQSFSPIGHHSYGVNDVRFSPQGTMLATSSIDGSTVLWSIRTGCKLHTFMQPNGNAVRVCRFTPDSTQLVTAGDDGTICIWNLAHRSLTRTIRGHEETVQALSISPNSELIASGCSQGFLQIWDMDGNCMSGQDAAHDLGITSADFSPLSYPKKHQYKDVFTLATCGHDNKVKLWLVKCGKFDIKLELLTCLNGHSSTVLCVRFNHVGNIFASGSLDKSIRLWDISGKCIKVLQGHDRYVASCAFSRDGNLLATGSNDKTLKIWDMSGKLTLESELVPFVRKPEKATMINGNKNEQVEDEDKISEVKLLQRINCSSTVNGCCFSKNSLPYQIVVATGEKIIRVFDTSDIDIRFKELYYSPIEAHRYSVNKVEFSPDGLSILSCSMDGTAAIWSLLDGERSNISLQTSGISIRSCRYSKDGRWIATGGDDEKAILWSMPSGNIRGELNNHTDTVAGISFSPDSLILATCDLVGTINIWQVETLKLIVAIKSAHDLGTQTCDFSPTEGVLKGDKYLLASGGNDSMVRLWTITYQTAKQVKYLEGHGGNVISVRFAPGGQLLASTASDKTARVWNVYQGECLFVLETHSSIVTCCSFSPDGAYLATGSLDKSLILWQLPKAITIRALAEERLKHRKRKLENWSCRDIEYWLTWINIPTIKKDKYEKLSGKDLKETSVHYLAQLWDLTIEEEIIELNRQLFWLVREDECSGRIDDFLCGSTPHEYICPITQELLREPVICADGFTYERAAIDEWFLAGKLSSPMTNLPLPEASYIPNIKMRSEIFTLIFGEPK